MNLTQKIVRAAVATVGALILFGGTVLLIGWIEGLAL